MIAGGTTAAFAAAVSAAGSGARVCLLEPTDWVGGQLTASGVPAVDEAWHRVVDPKTGRISVNVAAIARRRENMTPNFRALLDATGNPGRGWVSNYCFEPRTFLERQLLPMEGRASQNGRLVVYRDTVIKHARIDAEDGLIRAVVAIRRTPKPGIGWGGYDRLPSEDLADWYSPTPSERFDKTVLTFAARQPGRTVFIDATEWGELLVLAGAPYLQGVERVRGGRQGDDTCGQSTVFDFVERSTPPRSNSRRAPATSRDWDSATTKVGRTPGTGSGLIVGSGAPEWRAGGRRRSLPPELGVLGPSEARGQRLSLRLPLRAARRGRGGASRLARRCRSEGHGRRREAGARLAPVVQRAHVPAPFVPRQVTLDRGALGTGHGLAKLPYIRDTRRSIGLDGFLLTIDDLCARRAKPLAGSSPTASPSAPIRPISTGSSRAPCPTTCTPTTRPCPSASLFGP